jgi:hypothetical protein
VSRPTTRPWNHGLRYSTGARIEALQREQLQRSTELGPRLDDIAAHHGVGPARDQAFTELLATLSNLMAADR